MFSHLARKAVAERVCTGKLDFLDVVALVAFVFSLDILVVVANDWMLLVGISVVEVVVDATGMLFGVGMTGEDVDNRPAGCDITVSATVCSVLFKGGDCVDGDCGTTE
jgi:hypothetical protein